MKKIILFNTMLMLLFFSSYIIAADSSGIVPYGGIKSATKYTLATGKYNLGCDITGPYECSHKASDSVCPSGFNPTINVAPIGSANEGSGKYARGYRIKLQSIRTVTDASCPNSCYYLDFTEAKMDIDQDPDVGITINYTLYCEPN